MGSIRINLLGEFQCLDNDGQPLKFSGAKDQGVMATLALSDNYSCTRSRIIDLLWSDRGKEQAGASLRQSLWSLKKALAENAEDLFQVERKRIGLNPDLIETDLAEFNQLIDLQDNQSLEKAVTLYRGDLLEGLVIQDREWEEWLMLEREGLRTKLAEMLCTLIGRFAKESNIKKLIEIGRRLIDLDPFNEEGHRALMQGYAESNQRAQALKQFELCRELLRRELDTAPSASIQDLYRLIKEGEGDVVRGAESIPSNEVFHRMSHRKLRPPNTHLNYPINRLSLCCLSPTFQVIQIRSFFQTVSPKISLQN